MEKLIEQLIEVKEQIGRTVKSFESSLSDTKDSLFADGYNQALKHAITMSKLDVKTIDIRIRLLKQDRI